MPAVQLSLPFDCLDFPGRATVTVGEIALKTGYTAAHILGHIDAGRLVAIDSKLVGSRRSLRVPIDEYRRWVFSLLTGPTRADFIAELPDHTLRQIAAAIAARLAA